jgi:quercetin dioxygenase-like cupin family protein
MDGEDGIRSVALSDFPEETLTHDHFTGDGLLRHIGRRQPGLRVSHVHFEAGAETRPHFHKGPQILWFLEGAGGVASPRKVIHCKAGEIVQIDAYTEHWHGASGPDSTTSHLAITVGETVWEGEDGWDERR